MKTHPARMLVVLALAAALSACKQAAATPPVPVSEATQTTGAPAQPLPLATPVSQEPAAGVCASFDGETVEIRINADIPDPRCARVTPGQRLKVINATQGQVQVYIGLYDAEIEPGGEHTFDTPFGEYLAPGVHLLQVQPCCGPELWLVEEWLPAVAKFVSQGVRMSNEIAAITIVQKLDQLANYKAQNDYFALQKQELIDQVLTPEIKARLDEIEVEFADRLQAVNDNIAALEEEIKQDVLSHGASIKGTFLRAVWNKGRVTWDTRALDEFALTHPEVSSYRKQGEPFIRISKVE